MPNESYKKRERRKPPPQKRAVRADVEKPDNRKRPSEPFSEDYLRLQIALQHAPPGALLFLQLNSPVLRRQLPAQLVTDGLQRSFAVADFARLPTGPPPYGVLREFVEELHPKPELLFVDGLEHRIETQPDTILELNLGRERLADLGVVVVFLFPVYVIDLIRSHALNLWSWRSHHYVLDPSEANRGRDGIISSLDFGHPIAPGDTPEARERRIRILRRLLEEGLAKNRSTESLLHSIIVPLVGDLDDAGRIPEALSLLEHLKILPEQWKDSVDKAFLLDVKGQLLYTLGDFHSAKQFFQQALELRRQLLGEEHLDYATSLNNVAAIYQQEGQYDEAEVLYRRALAIREEARDPTHPRKATSLNNLALLYIDQGRYTEAEALLRHALTIREQTLGPTHPNVAMTLSDLANIYCTQGRYSEAESLYQRALTIREQVFGPAHPQVAANLNNLALVYSNLGKYDQAEPLYQSTLSLSQQLLGQEHPNVAIVLENYALLLRQTNRETEAEKLEAQAKTIREKRRQEQPGVKSKT
jgi:tetratricopeptide (TPR) repeat protein